MKNIRKSTALLLRVSSRARFREPTRRAQFNEQRDANSVRLRDVFLHTVYRVTDVERQTVYRTNFRVETKPYSRLNYCRVRCVRYIIRRSSRLNENSIETNKFENFKVVHFTLVIGQNLLHFFFFYMLVLSLPMMYVKSENFEKIEPRFF